MSVCLSLFAGPKWGIKSKWVLPRVEEKKGFCDKRKTCVFVYTTFFMASLQRIKRFFRRWSSDFSSYWLFDCIVRSQVVKFVLNFCMGTFLMLFAVFCGWFLQQSRKNHFKNRCFFLSTPPYRIKVLLIQPQKKVVKWSKMKKRKAKNRCKSDVSFLQRKNNCGAVKNARK